MRRTLGAFLTLSPLTAVTVIAVVVQNKVLAVALGPDGTGFYFLAASFLTLFSTIATLGISAALTKIVSELPGMNRTADVWPTLATALVITTILSFVLLVAMLTFAGAAAEALLGDTTLSESRRTFVLIASAAGVFPATWQVCLVGALRGLRSLRDYVRVGIFAALVPLITVSVGAVVEGARGAFLGFVLAQVINSAALLLVTARVSRRKGIPVRLLPTPGRARSLGSRLVVLGLLALIASLAASIAQNVLRTGVAGNLNLSAVGFFAGAWSVSHRLPTLVYQTLSSYLMPRISALGDDRKAIAREQNDACRLSLLGITPVLCVAIGVSSWLVPVLFSDQFLPMLDLLRLMLIGELFSVVLWTLSGALYATGRPVAQVVFEWSFWSAFTIGSLIAVSSGSLTGIGIAYIVAKGGGAFALFAWEWRTRGFAWSRPTAVLILTSTVAAGTCGLLAVLSGLEGAVLLGAVAATLAVWATTAFGAQERESIRSLVIEWRTSR